MYWQCSARDLAAFTAVITAWLAFSTGGKGAPPLLFRRVCIMAPAKKAAKKGGRKAAKKGGRKAAKKGGRKAAKKRR